jgi:DNA-binding beta-propeller fold protein YncE
MRATSRLMFFTVILIAAGVLPAAAQVVIATLPSEGFPSSAAVNSVTNTTYVANNCGSDPNCQGASGTVTVINGATFGEQNVNVGSYPYGVAVNSVTNKIYVATCGTDPSCSSNGAITVIDGATLTTQNVTVGVDPNAVAVDATTNKIYVSNLGCNLPPCSVAGTVTVIDGATLATQTVDVGYYPNSITVDSTHNKIYVPNVCGSTGNCGAFGNVTVIDGTTLATQTVNAQETPLKIAVNETTNKIYVVNNCGSDTTCQSAGSVTVIDGSTLATTQVAIGYYPNPIAVNPTTNEIYVADQCSATFNNCSTSFPSVAIINGSTLATNFVTICSVDTYPSDVEVNTTTNKIFLPCAGRNDGLGNSTGLSVAILDGATNTIFPVAVGDYPFAAVVNAVTNTVYVPNVGDNTVSVIGAATKLQFVSLPPCRVVDTRKSGGPIQGGTSRSFPLPTLGGCNIPATAAADSLNITIVPPQHSPIGYLTIWPTGQDRPVVSTMNSPDGRIKANAAIVQAGLNGAVSVYVSNTTDVVLDVDGYFAPSTPSTLQFYALTPCRVLDTRNPNGPLGGPYLTSGQERNFPVLSSNNCNIPSSAQAYSMNFTVVPYQGQELGYLTVWAQGSQQPVVSTLNNLTATIVANAALVPAGTGGGITAYASGNTQLVGDIDGYFAPAGTGGLSLYPTAPCRALDTRKSSGAFMGELTVNIEGSVCSPPSASQAYVLNATVVPQGAFGYLTLWPDGENRPEVSTLDAIDGAITSNMAIVPTTNGSIDAYASGTTQLILDISSFFAP